MSLPSPAVCPLQRAGSLKLRSFRFSKLLIALAIAGLSLFFLASVARADDPIDWSRAQTLRQRAAHGEQLSPEDQAYLDRAIAEHNRITQQQGNGPASRPTAPPPPPRDSTGFTPLTDFKPDEKYKGETGGLYPDGKNVPTGKLAALAAALTAKVVPLDADGQPAPDGKIVLLSIGMSNTTMEYQQFKKTADADPDKSPLLTIVDGAQGGKDSRAWVAAQAESVWANADKRLAAAGISPKQVEVLWIKQARINPAGIGEFPKHADALRDDWEKILTMAKTRYPNVRLAYCSSRIYAGYAKSWLNPEPYAYEGAFSVRGLIAMQAADPALNADPDKGDIKAPLALWGPYLWTDGTKGRGIDDLTWQSTDVGPDGTHPSPSGCQKVADLLLKFFKTDANAKTWFTGVNANH